MNLQKPPHGIEWARVWGRPGYTANPVRGCKHDCKWRMPDGTIAQCYAKSVAERLATKAYPNGFEEVTFHPKALWEIEREIYPPSGIFIDSMSDLFASAVERDWIRQVLATVAACPRHIFFSLTKHSPGLRGLKAPPNLWVGVSAPPTFMYGHELTPEQQRAMVLKQLQDLSTVTARVRWMSIEPLSFDIAPVLNSFGELPINWVVIGAASNGRKNYQPDPLHLVNLLTLCERHGIPVFFKGNLEWHPWRAEFPEERE